MKRFATAALAVGIAAPLFAVAQPTVKPQLFCHRTANEDVPENTLESLEQAALLGCNVVEIDLRRTLDGTIVLNHDGILERLTDGVGEVKSSDYATLEELDAGSWMSPRFAGLHMARFEDALRVARLYKIRLVLDIKEKGIGEEVLRILDQEGMRAQVEYGGEWEEIKKLDPEAKTPGDAVTWMQPGVTADEVREQHRQGKFVVVNFSANEHEMDLAGMKAAVAADVDAINVDYPRLGADAVGRPVEEKLSALILQASRGESASRARAIRMLARYQGFPLEEYFARWLLDFDAHVSRAAAEALVEERPHPDSATVMRALQSTEPMVRVNAIWVLNHIHAPLTTFMPLLEDKDFVVLQAALLAIAGTPGEVSAKAILPFLTHNSQEVRGAAARALAAHQPAISVKAIASQLDKEVAAERALYDERQRLGRVDFTQPEIDVIMRSFRCQMEMMRALSSIPGDEATRELIRYAVRPDKDFSQYNAIISGFQLWDRIAANPRLLVDALGSQNTDLAERAEWTLAQAAPAVLPAIRAALDSPDVHTSMRAIRIVAWQGDQASLTKLQRIAAGHSTDAALASWAIAKIEDLHPPL